MFNFEKPQFIKKKVIEKPLDFTVKKFVKDTILQPVGEKLRQFSVVAMTALSTLPSNAQEAQNILTDVHKNNAEFSSFASPEIPKNVVSFIEVISEGNLENIFYVNSEGAQLRITETGDLVALDLGSKVIQLGLDQEGRREILTWKNGEYISGVLELGEVSTDISNEAESQAFVLDGAHTISRGKNRLFNDTEGRFIEMFEQYGDRGPGTITRDQMQQQIDYSISENKEFISFIDSIGEDFSLALEDEDVFSSERLQAAENKHMQFYDNPYFSKGEKLQYSVENIFNVYDPVNSQTGERFSQSVTVFPLSNEYLTSNVWLQENIDQYDDLGSLFQGASGEVIAKEDDRFAEIIREIEFLKQNINQLPQGFEKKWIENVSIDELSNKNAFIGISDAVYEMGQDQKFAEGVAVGNAFAKFNIHPLQSVLIHEINMSGDLFPTDTHVLPEDVEYSRELFNEKGQECIITSPEDIDNIYQSDSYVDIVNFAYILKLLKENK